RAAAAEHGVAGAAAEHRADVGALAVLQQHDDDQHQAHHHVEHGEEDRHPEPSPASTMRANDSGSRLAPPTSAPSTSGCANSSAAFSGFTEPPYWMRIASAAAG